MSENKKKIITRTSIYEKIVNGTDVKHRPM